ncbi:MAG: type II secretion system F family protein [Pseudonocardia sp.]|nr:type II secretion system F family protein [Pseudonocardia sp.]
MSATAPGGAAATLGLLALSLLVLDGPAGHARLRELATPPPDRPPAPPLRPSWVVVGALALGALAWVAGGPLSGVVTAVVAGAGGTVAARRQVVRQGAGGADAGELASRWELLAVCLEAGLPVAPAVAASAEPLTGAAGTQLRRVAGRLELGADPADAWRAAEENSALATFARAAGRSAGTGSALAQVARTEGRRIRAILIDTAQARAQRAAVLITGPLGLCFLPAFLILGIAPVVVGLAGEALAQW